MSPTPPTATIVTERLSNLALSPTGFVFDPRSGATFTVNATGRAVLETLRDGGGLQAVVDRLSSGFSCDAADLKRDALEYVRLLREHELLPKGFELD